MKKFFKVVGIGAAICTGIGAARPYNLMCKDEQFLKVNQNWV
ncbi:MAG: hypothetical protein SPI42_04675 [Lactobacillus johnsonii]|nr:hypothetical protein [Lactobacillus johnsonii]MDY6195425.1 hypothetical protein [Lactobacillus johnsonii]